MEAFVHSAEILVDEDVDAAAVGAAVTVALCGHWEHDGACRWPHNNAIAATGVPRHFRTLFVAADDEAEVRARIEGALARADGWQVASSGPAALEADERDLAVCLARSSA